LDSKVAQQDKMPTDVNKDLICKFIKSNRFTKLEHFITQLRKIDRKKTTQSFMQIKSELLIKSATKGALAAYQIVEQLYKFKTWLFISRELNCDELIDEVLRKYLDHQVHTERRFKQLPLEKFLSTYSYSLKINSKIAQLKLESEFLNNLAKEYKGSDSLSIVFQMLRRITDFNADYINPVKQFLKTNLPMLVEDINNQDMTKSIPGLIELSKSKLKEEALEILILSESVLKQKIMDKTNQVTSIRSVVEGLRNVDESIENEVSNRLIASL